MCKLYEKKGFIDNIYITNQQDYYKMKSVLVASTVTALILGMQRIYQKKFHVAMREKKTPRE